MPKRTIPAHVKSRPLPGLVLLLGAAGACTVPPIDPGAPEPKGVIVGTVTYFGRPVDCEFPAGGTPVVKGRVILTLIDATNPLPPEGTATSPLDLFVIGGEDIFTDYGNECFDDITDASRTISRSVPFRWPNVALGRSYRIQAFYDQEGDFSPLFSVQQATSAGDVVGGFLVNPRAPVPQFDVLTFPTAVDAPNGYESPPISVALGAVAATDAPMFYVGAGGIASDHRLTLPLPSLMPSIRLSMYGDATSRARIEPSLDAMGLTGIVDLDSDVKYAWYVDPIDIDRDGDTECNGTDGDDCHPILGGLGVIWSSPVILLQRARNAIEILAGVPTVAMIPQASLATGGAPRVQFPDVSAQMIPFAAVFTNPAAPQCTIAYFPNGTGPGIVSQARGGLDPQATLECADLPTGYFGVNVLGGYAVTSPTAIAVENDPMISQTGFRIDGGTFGSQLWALPNELGDYRQVGDVLASSGTDPGPRRCLAPGDLAGPGPAVCVPDQSLDGAVVVHDPNPATPYGRRTPGEPSATHCDPTVYNFDGDTWTAPPVPSDPNSTPRGADFNLCCSPIMHLCNVPLCPMADVRPAWLASGDPDLHVRTQPTSYTMGTSPVPPFGPVAIPNCISFPMPAQCCGTGNQP